MSSEAQLSLPLVIPLESLFQTHSTVQHQALVFSWAFFWERVVVQGNGEVKQVQQDRRSLCPVLVILAMHPRFW